jgi:hypothetical protein
MRLAAKKSVSTLYRPIAHDIRWFRGTRRLKVVSLMLTAVIALSGSAASAQQRIDNEIIGEYQSLDGRAHLELSPSGNFSISNATRGSESGTYQAANGQFEFDPSSLLTRRETGTYQFTDPTTLVITTNHDKVWKRVSPASNAYGAPQPYGSSNDAAAYSQYGTGGGPNNNGYGPPPSGSPYGGNPYNNSPYGGGSGSAPAGGYGNAPYNGYQGSNSNGNAGLTGGAASALAGMLSQNGMQGAAQILNSVAGGAMGPGQGAPPSGYGGYGNAPNQYGPPQYPPPNYGY